MKIRTRFSPSPTGMIHLGNARAALFSALFAKKNQGVFILRIEDTDVARSEEKFVESLQANLNWLGVHWQEGPGANGQFGPYWQSQRQAIYAKYYAMLEDKHLIYPCFCSDQTLAIARKLQLSRSQAPRYAGTCQSLSKEEIEKNLAEGRKPAWRFAIPKNTVIEFFDVVKGQQHFESNDIGDFIVRRADGTSPFLFCNAIDDALMEVSHVLRGEDHLANTPRQLMILQALGLPQPDYGHLSLILGDDGAPLSKRHGSYSLQELHETGYLPQAILNYLARLGHGSDSPILCDFDQLAEHFYLEKLSRSPARFDKTQLLYWQKMAVQALTIPEFWHWVGGEIENQIPESLQTLFAETVKTNVAFPHEVSVWARNFFHDNVILGEEESTIIRQAGEQFFVEAELAVDQFGIDLDLVLQEMKKTLGLSGKKLFTPLRAALTGKIHGPELGAIAKLLGSKKIKHRLSKAFARASEKEE